MYFICYTLPSETKCEVVAKEDDALARAKKLMREHDLDETEMFVFNSEESYNLIEELDQS